MINTSNAVVVNNALITNFIQNLNIMKKSLFITVFFLFISLGTYAQEGFIGEVRLFAGNFAPRGWAFCDGQLLAISTNTALFSILGTTYGGDGRTTFGLPDLRGRTV